MTGPKGRYRNSIFNGYTSYDNSSVDTEHCIDQMHPWHDQRRYTKSDIGGPFELTKSRTQYLTTPRFDNEFVNGTIGAKGYTGWTPLYFNAALPGESTLNTWGATAVARSLPNNPSAGLATFLGELRSDGLPRLPGSELRESTQIARSAGSEYLNYEFGWVPLVSDVRKFAYAIRNSKQILDQYVRQSDRKIRRRYVGPQVQSARISSGGGFMIPSGMNISSQISIQETATTGRQFSGAFRYHIPMGNSQYERWMRYEALSNKLLGTRITPEVLWDIAPWTWAIDWFTNAGDVIHNIGGLGSDGMVMQYGYATEYQYYTADLTAVCSFATLGVPVGTTSTAHHERKYIRRVAANPYGFGITDASLSAKQQAILAALGLSRGRRNQPSD